MTAAAAFAEHVWLRYHAGLPIPGNKAEPTVPAVTGAEAGPPAGLHRWPVTDVDYLALRSESYNPPQRTTVAICVGPAKLG